MVSGLYYVVFMRVTAQPFGLPLTKQRLGKWTYPKIFPDVMDMWRFVETWYPNLEYGDFDESLWSEIAQEEIAPFSLEVPRWFPHEPHIGEDFLRAFLFPSQKGILIIKDAIRA